MCCCCTTVLQRRATGTLLFRSSCFGFFSISSLAFRARALLVLPFRSSSHTGGVVDPSVPHPRATILSRNSHRQNLFLVAARRTVAIGSSDCSEIRFSIASNWNPGVSKSTSRELRTFILSSWYRSVQRTVSICLSPYWQRVTSKIECVYFQLAFKRWPHRQANSVLLRYKRYT